MVDRACALTAMAADVALDGKVEEVADAEAMATLGTGQRT